ncbi:MAG: hypothetical protein PWP23_3038 [Candidatus Sumerlaeota bacterium]|nr:hypothetical protein [Candidatus Sumerlaeota bacterium]
MPPLQPVPLDTPALRPVEIIPVNHQGQRLLLVRDPLGILEGIAALPPDPLVLLILQMADGETHIDEIAKAAREQTGLIITTDKIRNLVSELDKAGLLLSDTFFEMWEKRRGAFRALPSRASVIFQGEDRLALIKQLGDELRRHTAEKNGAPEKLNLPHPNVRGILAPHIDYMRGGPVYSWAYKAIAEHTTATTFIVLGTLHQPSTHPFIATDKTYETPLGNVEVDTAMLKELEAEFGGELWRDEYLHGIEHTVELQAVYLKHVLKDRPFKIVPILVGSCEHLLHEEEGVQPRDDEEIAAFVSALRTVLRNHGDRVVLIGGVDFAHCGPEFGDNQINTPEVEQAVEQQDRAMLKAIEEVNPAAFFDSFRETLNERKVCSIAAIYCVLAALEDTHQGTVLQYDQANSDDRTCMVTFASVAFTPKSRSKIILLQ